MKINVDINFRVQREKVLKNGKIRLIDLSSFHWFGFEKIDRFFGIRKVTRHLEDRKKASSDRAWIAASIMGRSPNYYNKEFMYWLDACTLSCHFCYLHPEVFFANYEGGLFSMDEILDEFEKIRGGKDISYFRISGGEPSIVPEQWLWVLEGLKRRNLQDIFVSSETNLTTGRLIKQLMKDGEISADLFKRICRYENFALFPCFKGTDPDNFYQNTGADPKFFNEQFDSLELYLKEGIRVYPYIINPDPRKMREFLGTIEKRFGKKVLLNLHILKVQTYGNPQVSRRAFNWFYNYYVPKLGDYERNYEGSVKILDEFLREKYGTGYREIPRERTRNRQI